MSILIKNDDKIMGLREQIEKKKALLGASKRFNPVTNCIINLDEVNHNINVLQKPQLINLLILT